MKKILAFLMVISILTLVTGCSSVSVSQSQAMEKEENLQDTLNTILSTYSSYKNVADKYGCYQVSSKVDNAALDVSFAYEEIADIDYCYFDYGLITDKDSSYSEYESDTIFINFGDDYYYKNPKKESTYSKLTDHDEDSVEMNIIKDYYDCLGVWSGDKADSCKIEKAEDGYIIKYSYDSTDDDTSDYTCNAIVLVNEDLSLKEVTSEYTNADGLFCTEKSSYVYGVDKPVAVDEILAKLEEADGKTRCVTYNIVENGKVIEIFKSTVPVGFYDLSFFPLDLVEESTLYYDIECTQVLESFTSDDTRDSVCYIPSINMNHQ